MLNSKKLIQLFYLGIICSSSLVIAKEGNNLFFDGCNIPLPSGYQESKAQQDEGMTKRIFSQNRDDIHSIELRESSAGPSKMDFENIEHIVQKDGIELFIIRLDLKYVETPKIILVKNKDMELSFMNIQDDLVKSMLKNCLESASIDAISTPASKP